MALVVHVRCALRQQDLPGVRAMAAVLAGLKSVDFYRKLKRDLQQVMLRYLQRELSASLTRERQPGRDRERGRDTNKEGCETRFVYACVEHTHVWNVYHLRTRLPNAWATEQELTEASFAGAALSVCAAIFMILLVIGEFSTYMAVTTESKVVLDHFETSADDTLQVRFFLDHTLHVPHFQSLHQYFSLTGTPPGRDTGQYCLEKNLALS